MASNETKAPIRAAYAIADHARNIDNTGVEFAQAVERLTEALDHYQLVQVIGQLGGLLSRSFEGASRGQLGEAVDALRERFA